jgi:universal stress protein A
MEKVDKILVPVDFSPCSEAALTYAVFLAGQLQATLLLAHVIPPMGYPIDFATVQPVAYQEFKRGIGQALDKTADRWRKKGVLIETHLWKGEPAVEVGAAAAHLACDLIVMGTHGRKGVASLLMGSVAEKVVRSASVPVVTIKPDPLAGPVQQKEALHRGEAVQCS